MVCKHWEGQSVECMEDSLWRQHIPVQGILICPELWHLDRRQVHCDRLWWQEGHCIWSYLLEQTALDRSMFIVRNNRLYSIYLPSQRQHGCCLQARGRWAGGLAVPDWNRRWCCCGPGCRVLRLCPSSLIQINTCTASAAPQGTKKKIMSCCFFCLSDISFFIRPF